MTEELEELRRRIHNLSNEELAAMLREADQYRQVALDYANRELKERKITLNEITASNTDSQSIYAAQWDDYRKRNKIFWLVFATYLPGVVVIGIPLARFFHTGVMVGIIAGFWMIAFVVSRTHLRFWKCPRCSKPFFQKWWYHNSFARRCVHCALAKWS